MVRRPMYCQGRSEFTAHTPRDSCLGPRFRNNDDVSVLVLKVSYPVVLIEPHHIQTAALFTLQLMGTLHLKKLHFPMSRKTQINSTERLLNYFPNMNDEQ